MVDTTVEDIMGATYCALCKHGYAELTMQDIADESAKSKATLHYHFDSKRDLLLAFLDYLFERFQTRVDSAEGNTPAERLHSIAETILAVPETDSRRELKTALLEIKAQAPYDEAYRDRLERFDDLLYDRIAALVASGVEEGVFRSDADPEEAASFLVTFVTGAQTRYVAVGTPLDRTESMFHRYVRENLLASPEVASE
ncbi:MAG: TetR/AcrR family transcriptional regulator [Halobacteriota archaeon]